MKLAFLAANAPAYFSVSDEAKMFDDIDPSIESILSCAPVPPKAALAFGANLISTPILRSGSCTRIFQVQI